VTKAKKAWRQYEEQVFAEFRRRYPGQDILFDQQLVGRHSRVRRQVDILVRSRLADVEVIGAFDCKHFKSRVDVQTIDSMVGFLDDLGAAFGGVISTAYFGHRDQADRRIVTTGIGHRDRSEATLV
jgi:hypothetical protein